jgi:hypothetical protein
MLKRQVRASALNMRALSIIALVFVIASILPTNHSFGSTEEYFVVQPPKVWLKEGGLLNEYSLRHHDLSVGIILKSSTSEFRDYVIITEIRKLPEGTSSFIFTVPEKTDLGEEEDIRVPWVPESSGNFQVRVFLISDSENPQVLSSVQTADTTIYDDSFKGLVKLTKSACDGFCPTYEIEVFENRTVVFEGHAYVTQPGRHAFEASQDQIGKIIDAINKADFFSADFKFADLGAEGLPVTMLEINLGGKWRQVHYFGGADVPSDLAELERIVGDLVDLKGWIRV